MVGGAMQIIGENVDRLITVEMRTKNIPARGMIRQLYEAARRKLNVNSLTLFAAQKIIEHVKRNDTVFILTGCANPPLLPHGETDGPMGAASLARALCLGLGAKPLFVVGERDINPIKQCTLAVGLGVEDYEIVKRARNTACIMPFPYFDVTSAKAAKELLDKYEPKAVFSFETMGPNIKGELHSILGFNLTASLPKLYHVFQEANSRGILTIAGLDGGNEIGSGVVEEEVRKVTPYGNACQCPCKSGNACCISADVSIPAGSSNWAAYGVAAMLGFLLKKPDLIQDANTERRMLEACVMTGAVDGITFRPVPMVDGTWDATNQGLVTILRNIVENGLIEEELGRAADGY